MKRLSWFRRYLSQSGALRNFYFVCLAHGIINLLLIARIKEYTILLLLIIIAFALTAVALLKFGYRLYEFSSTDLYPQDVFTYEVLKSAVGFAFTAVLAVPSARLFWHITRGQVPIHVPLTWQTILFVYGFSVYVWLFYLMSRLLNKGIK